jgi:hypothetical protein
MDENAWVELPTITPNHVIQSRRIRHVLTGDLEYNIMTCPKFVGKEKDYVTLNPKIKFLAKSPNRQNLPININLANQQSPSQKRR